MNQPWYAAVYGQSYFENYRDEFSADDTRRQADELLARLELAPGARLLDLACGFGRHSLELARRGFDVTGLDLSPFLLDRARESPHALAVTWIQADMREIPIPDAPFDAVFSLFSSFGFLENDAEEARVAAAVVRVLKPGGVFLIETVNRELVLRKWQPLRWRDQENGGLEAHHLRFAVETGTLHAREVVIHPDGRRVEENTSLRLWSCTELFLLLGAAGFGEFAVWGDLDGRKYTWDSQRMVVAARRLS